MTTPLLVTAIFVALVLFWPRSGERCVCHNVRAGTRRDRRLHR